METIWFQEELCRSGETRSIIRKDAVLLSALFLVDFSPAPNACNDPGKMRQMGGGEGKAQHLLTDESPMAAARSLNVAVKMNHRREE